MTTGQMYAPTSAEANRYQAILEKKIQDGARSAAHVIERLHTEAPRDSIASTRAFGFDGFDGATGTTVREAPFASGMRMMWGDEPLVDALATEAQALGAVPVDGLATETRVALKVVIPRVVEPIPGEFLVLGGEWSNSDFGNGTNSFRAFAWRVVCLNGMTRENLLRQIHLGGRLGDDVEYSGRTYRLDTAASVSALRDVVKGALGEGGMSRLTSAIQKAHAEKASAQTVRGALKAFPKEVQKAAVDAFESADVINLPAGETKWRASNAISWIARHTEDEERRLDLERVAGSLA